MDDEIAEDAEIVETANIPTKTIAEAAEDRRRRGWTTNCRGRGDHRDRQHSHEEDRRGRGGSETARMDDKLPRTRRS